MKIIMCSLVGFCLFNKYLIIVASRNLNSLVHNSPKAINNRIFKTEFKYEEYLNILEIKDAILFCRFRTTNNELPHRDSVMEEHTKRKS